MSKANGNRRCRWSTWPSAAGADRARVRREALVVSLGENGMPAVEAIPTGALSLDLALGVGGCHEGGSSRSTGRSPRARRR